MGRRKDKTICISNSERMTQKEINRFIDNIDDATLLKMSWRTQIFMRGYLVRNGYDKKTDIDNDLKFGEIQFFFGEVKNADNSDSEKQQ